MTIANAERVAIVTGASSGVGLETAKLLAGQGWRVIAHGRDADRSAAAEREIAAAAASGGRVEMIRADLANLAEVAGMADAIDDRTDRIDVVLNNAGGVRDRLIVTPEGNEATFAGNHLGHFLLAKRLMVKLRATAAIGAPGAVRVVSVSSEGHEYCPGIDWDDLQLMRDWVSGRNYCLAKLCNILFTRELARRGAADGIVALAMHPGEVRSNFASHAVPEMKAYMDTLVSAKGPEVAANTLAWLATAAEPGTLSGGYFHELRQVEPSAAAQDDAAAMRLWEESEALLHRAGY